MLATASPAWQLRILTGARALQLSPALFSARASKGITIASPLD
jgi:hypothetical protein